MTELLALVRDGDGYQVKDTAGGVVARLALTSWGKWKIIGEDVYAKTPEALVERLWRRL